MDFKSNLRVKYRDRVDSPFPSVPISYPAHNPPLSSHATPPHRFTPFRDELQRSTPGTLSGSSSSWPRRGPSKTCSRNSVRTAPYLNLNIDDTGHALPAVIAISHRANDSLPPVLHSARCSHFPSESFRNSSYLANVFFNAYPYRHCVEVILLLFTFLSPARRDLQVRSPNHLSGATAHTLYRVSVSSIRAVSSTETSSLPTC